MNHTSLAKDDEFPRGYGVGHFVGSDAPVERAELLDFLFALEGSVNPIEVDAISFNSDVKNK